MQKLLSFLFLLTIPVFLFSQNTKKVLLIGIDGLRPDALEFSSTPSLDALRDNGLYSADALNDDITISGPGWSAILCGVWSEKHLVTNNAFAVDDYENYPMFFDYVNSFSEDLNTVSICHWAPINDFIVQDLADTKINVGSDIQVSIEANKLLTEEDPDVMFLHFDDVDHAGHASGFSINVPEYISAIEGVDVYVGSVISAIQGRPTYSTEDWLIIVSTDHGGLGFSHGGSSIDEEKIFLIVSGDEVASEVISKDSMVVYEEIDNCMGDFPELQFDGDNDFVQIPSNTAYDFGSDQDFTIECRVRTSVAQDVAIIGNKNWDSGLNSGFVFSFSYPSGPEWKVNIGDGVNRVDINSGGEIADGEWHALSVSFDRDGEMKMYQDGEFIEAADFSMTNIRIYKALTSL